MASEGGGDGVHGSSRACPSSHLRGLPDGQRPAGRRSLIPHHAARGRTAGRRGLVPHPAVPLHLRGLPTSRASGYRPAAAGLAAMASTVPTGGAGSHHATASRSAVADSTSCCARAYGRSARAGSHGQQVGGAGIDGVRRWPRWRPRFIQGVPLFTPSRASESGQRPAAAGRRGLVPHPAVPLHLRGRQDWPRWRPRCRRAGLVLPFEGSRWPAASGRRCWFHIFGGLQNPAGLDATASRCQRLQSLRQVGRGSESGQRRRDWPRWRPRCRRAGLVHIMPRPAGRRGWFPHPAVPSSSSRASGYRPTASGCSRYGRSAGIQNPASRSARVVSRASGLASGQRGGACIDGGRIQASGGRCWYR